MADLAVHELELFLDFLSLGVGPRGEQLYNGRLIRPWTVYNRERQTHKQTVNV